MTAAENGSISAKYHLARHYYGQDDYRNALRCYKQAAESGISAAAYELGCMYDDGKGVDKDEEQAMHWYVEALKGGDPDAANTLGVRYMFGSGVDQDRELAYRLFETAADQGHEIAMINLQNLQEMGYGPKDEEV
jgi:TPR repeat protein